MEETVKHKHPVQNTFQAVGSKYIKFACLYQSIWYTLESEKKTYLFFLFALLHAQRYVVGT